MNHSTAMRLVQRIGDLHSVLEDLVEWQRALFQPFRQRLSVDAFHHQIVHTVLTAHVIQHADMRMVQARNGFCLTPEALLADGIGGKLRGKNLDSNGALQPRVARAIHFTHPACAERSNDLIRAEFGARGEGHPSGALYPPKELPCSGFDDSGRVVGKPELIVRPKRVHAIWRWVALPSSRGLKALLPRLRGCGKCGEAFFRG